MNKRAFYLTLTVSLVCLVGIAVAIRVINQTEPESEEGILMHYTCAEIKAYETLAAEQDLQDLQAIIRTHVNEYPAETASRLNAAMNDLDSLQNEAAFHNTDQSLYNSHFRIILRSIAYAELAKAATLLAANEPDGVRESLDHAQHCLHDALNFSSEAEAAADKDLLNEINTLFTKGATSSGLEMVMERL